MSAEYPIELNKQVINDYRTKHNIDVSVSDSEIISIMIKNGDEKLLQAKFDKIEKDLLFGFGFADSSIDNLQISHKYLSYENSTIDTERDKKLTRNEERALMEFTQSYLMDSVNSAIDIHNNYISDMGPLSYLWQGLKDLANYFDISKDNRNITTVNERANDLNSEYKETELIANASNLSSFGARFERIRGVKYDPHQVKKFAQNSEKYMVILAHKEKYDKLNQGIAEIKEIYHKEQQIEKLRAMGQNIPAEANPKVNFDEKFIQIIDEYCEGDENLKAFYIKFVSEGIESKDELEEKEKFLNALNKLATLTKVLYENELDGKSFEYYERAYQNGYSKTFGGVNPKEESQAWVMKQKQGEAFVKMGIIIATTVATGGSGFVATMGQNLAKKVGVTTAGQLIKAGMTLEGVFVGAAVDYANALGSESGLTKEKNREILQNTAYMLPFAFFGAYISGPTGQMLVDTLQGKISQNLSTYLQSLCADAASATGFATEIALDTLFESVLFDGDIMAVIKGNATGEAQARALNALAMMISGGRANTAAANISKKIGMEDFKVSIDVDETGKMKLALVAPDGKFYPVDGAEEIIAGAMAKVLDSDIKPEEIKVEESIKTPETTDDVKFIAKDATTSKILKIPVKEYNVSVKLQNNSPLDINIIEKMDGSREVNLYWENKLVKDGTTPPTDKNLPGIPLGEDLIKIPFENGEDIYINVTHKLNGVKDFQILDKNPNLSSENNETKETNKSSENNAIITEKPKENPTIQSAKIFSNTAETSKYAISDPKAKTDLLEKQIIENYKYKLEYIEKDGIIYYVKSDKSGVISEIQTALESLPKEREETYVAANNSKIIITKNNNNKIIRKTIIDNESNLDFYIDYIPYDSKEKITGIHVHKNTGNTDEIAYNASYQVSHGNLYLEREAYVYFDNEGIMNKETRIYDESGKNVIGQILKPNSEGETEAHYYEISPYTNGNKVFIDYDPNDRDFTIQERSSVFNNRPQFEYNMASKNYKKKYNAGVRLFNGEGFDNIRAEITVGQDGKKSVNLYINDKLVDNGTYMPDKKESTMLISYEDSLIIRYNNDEDELLIKVKCEADGSKKFKIYDVENELIYPIREEIKAGITKDNANKILEDLLDGYSYNYYKDKILENFDYENADIHLKNLKRLLQNRTNRLVSIIEHAYFSSKEGAEALEYVLNNFDNRGYGRTISEVDQILQDITPEEVFRGIKRGLSNINDLKTYSQLTDEEYERRENSPYKNDLDYVSSNDNINKILCKLGRENIKISRIIDEIILKSIAENPAKENEILDCYSTIFTSSNINIWAISEDNVINSYKKAYEYIKENNIENAKIIILDSNSSNLYSKIWDPWYGDKFNDNWNFIFFDKNGNFIRSDLGHISDTQITESIKNTSGYINYDADITATGDRIYFNNSKKEVFDNDGNLLYIETYEESGTLFYKYDIYREYPNGQKYKIGSADIVPGGETVIEKTLVSENGIKTDYVYVESPNGSRMSYIKNTNAQGEVISENKYQYKVLDDNNFKTIENGIEYNINYKSNKVIVTNSLGDKVIIKIGENGVNSDGVLSKKLLPLLKQMPGSFYFAIDKYGLNKIGMNMGDAMQCNACYNSKKNLIDISEEWITNLYTLAHEFGHYLDEFLKISSNPEIVETYMKERQALIENQSQFETTRVHYFVSSKNYISGNIKGSIDETVAEIIALLYASNTNSKLEMRGQFLQQYFPETFAKVAKILTEYQIKISY